MIIRYENCCYELICGNFVLDFYQAFMYFTSNRYSFEVVIVIEQWLGVE